MIRRIRRFVLYAGSFFVSACLHCASFLGRRKRILFLCQSPLMAEHLRPYWLLLSGDKRLSFWVCFEAAASLYPDSEITRMKELLPLRSCKCLFAPLLTPRLIITADHSSALSFFFPFFTPALYVGHGAEGKVLAGSNQSYAYGMSAYVRGRLSYALMFEYSETNKKLAIEGDPNLASFIKVIGSVQHDELIAAQASRKVFRRALKLCEEDIALLVLITWGPNSLLEVLGEEFVHEAARLTDKFKFFFALHPNEFRTKSDGNPGWGMRLQSQQYPGLRFREISESLIPYMIASDIVISDHTSLVQSAVLLRKPVIVSPVPGEFMRKGSVTAELFGFAPMLSQARDLEAVLGQAYFSYPAESLNDLANSMHSFPSQALNNAKDAIYSLLRLPPFSRAIRSGEFKYN